MTNMLKLMKQAATLQKDMERMKQDLAGRTVEFSSGGGMVKVVAGCDMTIKSIKIDPKVVDASDVGMLEDLVLAAVEGAMQEAKATAAKEMSKMTAGLGLPDIGM